MCERGGGSSRLLSSAFWAESFIVCASSITNTRRRASKGTPAISPISSRTWSTRISGSARGRPVLVSLQPSASTRSGWMRKLRQTSSSGWRSASTRSASSCAGSRPCRDAAAGPAAAARLRDAAPARTGSPAPARARASSCRRPPAPPAAARAAPARARAHARGCALIRSWPRISPSVIAARPPAGHAPASPSHSRRKTTSASCVPSRHSQREGSSASSDRKPARTRSWNSTSSRSSRSCPPRRPTRRRPTATGTSRSTIRSGRRPPVASRASCRIGGERQAASVALVGQARLDVAVAQHQPSLAERGARPARRRAARDRRSTATAPRSATSRGGRDRAAARGWPPPMAVPPGSRVGECPRPDTRGQPLELRALARALDPLERDERHARAF